MPAAGHRADEDAVVEEPLAHADAVTEDRAAAERARGIHGDDRHASGLLSIQAGEAIHERRFAAARRAGDPDRLREAGLWVELAHGFRRAGLVVLDDRDKARDRSLVPRARASEQIARRGPPCRHQSTRRSWRAITIRWTSLVPSPISMRRTSRRCRSIGKSCT